MIYTQRAGRTQIFFCGMIRFGQLLTSIRATAPSSLAVEFFMKLRIKADSLRLRLGPSEILRLLEDGRVAEGIHFGVQPDAALTYALELSNSGDALSLRYEPGQLTVLVPREQACAWAAGDDVGIVGEMSVGAGSLTLLVEKDFACIDGPGEENADTFPNPKAGAVC
jgi:hypothetical protein